MLGKLLKYDFKSLFKALIPIYSVSILLALVARVSNSFVDKIKILSIPNGFITALFIIVIIGIPIATFIFTIIKFYQNLIKDEGYLMHTLPVSKHQLVLSKTISACLALAISCLLSIALIFIGFYGVYIHSDLFSDIGQLLKVVDKLFLVLTILSIILSFISQQVMFYAAISLGQKHNNKIAFSIVYLIVLYFINQIAGLIVLIPMFVKPELSKYLNDSMPPMNILNFYMGSTLVLSLIFIIAYYFVTVKVLDKKLNLE